MPKILSQEQIDQFYELGYLSPIDVMSEDEAISLRHRFEKQEAEHPEYLNNEGRNNAHLSFMCLDEIAHHPRIIDVVEDLIGEDIALWATVLFIKEPSSSHFVSWHQDATYMGMSNNNFVTPWLALSPSNRETGCLSMIPGSHHGHIQNHEDTYEQDNILTRGQRVNGVDESKAVDLILRPGQMSVHHGEVIHGSQPNTSQQRRVGFAMQSYCAPNVVQTVGENYWLPIRGRHRGGDTKELVRPKFDLDPEADRGRKLADKNLRSILYKDAKQMRAF